MFLYVIDLEMFNDNIIKEVGVACKYFKTGFIIRPPFAFANLSERRKSQNIYVTKNLHNIDWAEGDIEYSKIADMFRYFHNLDAIYLTKGLQKVNILRTWLPGACVINLEDFGCPKYQDLLKQDLDTCTNYSIDTGHCSNFSFKHDGADFMHCAEKKAKRFFDWADKNVKNSLTLRRKPDPLTTLQIKKKPEEEQPKYNTMYSAYFWSFIQLYTMHAHIWINTLINCFLHDRRSWSRCKQYNFWQR